METELIKPRYYLPAIEDMRLLLMAGAILYTYSFYTALRELSGVVFGFVFPALYIISGYVVLRESQNIEKRILRTIGRTALCFVVLAGSYFGLSLLFEPAFTLATVSSRAFWVDFLLFNIWSLPIGSTIWFVQALLYAYIIIYIIYKLKLLKLDIFFAAICLAVTMLTGELASVVGFNFLGHTYLGGNFLTRALPYILIGCFIHRKKENIGDRLYRVRHIVILVSGIVLSVGEYLALSYTGHCVYTGHLFGMGIVAIAICLFCFYTDGIELRTDFTMILFRFELNIPFLICSPIYYLLVTWFVSDETLLHYLGNFAGIITLVLSFFIFYTYILIRYAILEIIFIISDRKNRNIENTNETGSDAPSKQDTPE